MGKEKTKIVIVKELMVCYSKGFYDRLLQREDFDVHIFCQSSMKNFDIETIHHHYPFHVDLVKTISMGNDILSWQFLPYKKILNKFDVYVLTGNPRNISNIILSIVLRSMGKKVVLWTMGPSFKSKYLNEKIRLLWAKIFNYILLYTNDNVSYFRDMGFKKQYIVSQNNGLDQKEIDKITSKWPTQILQTWRKDKGLAKKDVLLSCARLIAKNDFSMFIEVFSIILKKHPNTVWVLIGDGAEYKSLQNQVFQKNIGDNVIFLGSIFNEEELAPWFLSARVFIHPAAIGLGLIHAFGYGLPVVTHDYKELHGPEFTIFKNGETGYTYKKDDIRDFADKVSILIECKADREEMSKKNLYIAQKEYNVDIMVDRFANIVNHAYKN